MREKRNKNSKLIKNHKSKIKHYDSNTKKNKEKYYKYDDDDIGTSKKICKETKTHKKVKKNYPTNLMKYNKSANNKKSEFSYNSFDYFDKNISENNLSSNYIIEQKLKYEKEVFEKAYGLSLDDDICYDNSLFKKKNGNINNNSNINNKNEENKKYYECYSCKAKNYYSNVQCYKCKKLRKF